MKMANVHRFGLFVFLFAAVCSFFSVSVAKYEPNWDSIDSRPIPSWYDEAKIGIFVHWGVYSVPSYAWNSQSEWFWYYWLVKDPQARIVQFMKDNYKPDFTYADFAKDFTAEFFNPDEWADIFMASGAKYVVFTSKHHEGYTNWPSKYAFNWNSMSLGPNKDLVGMLAESVRTKTNLRFGLYHSLMDWYNPLFEQDRFLNWTTNDFVTHKAMPEMYELVNIYQPDVFFSDGSFWAPSTYWNCTYFLAWLFNDSPIKDKVVTNDRWGLDTICKHGGVLTCGDRYQPGVLIKKKWVNAMTIDRKSWGYRRNANLSAFLSLDELIETMVITVSCNGNILINVGPTKAGTIIPIFEERLRGLGDWLKVNGEAIYGSRPWVYQNDTVASGAWYTSKKAESGSTAVYAIVFDWPDPGTFKLGSPMTTESTVVSLLGYPYPISWSAQAGTQGISLQIPTIPFNKMPCDNARVFRMENLAN